MSHANALLTPKGRLKLASAIVDEGWPVRRAAERFQCSPTTAKKWADRYRAGGQAAMVDRSSRPHHSPNQTPTRRERRIINLRFTRRWGPHRIAYHLHLPRSTAGAVLNRHNMPLLRHLDQNTGLAVRRPQPRRYEHPAPGDLIHIDIKKLGRIPDGGGHRKLGRTIGNRNNKKKVAVTPSSTTPSMTTAAGRTQRSSATNAKRPPLRSSNAPKPSTQTIRSPSNE